MKKRTTPLGPAGKAVLAGLGGLAVLLLLWQFVIPFFFGSTQPSEANGQAKTSNDSRSSGNSGRPELEGAIVDANSGRNLGLAVIKKADGSELTKADEQGKFSISKLPTDKDKLVVSAPGFEPAPLPLAKDAAKQVQLKPLVLTGTLVDSETQQPIANRLVRGGDLAAITDEQGKFSFTGLAEGSKVRVELIGYEAAEKAVEAKAGDFKLETRSTIFNGSLTDSKTGKPIANALIKSADNQMATTGEDGTFRFSDLKRDASTTLKVRAPGHKIQSFKATELAKGVKIEPFLVRSIYVPGVFAVRANYEDLFTRYWKMAERGEINAIVLGVKNDDDGKLFYESKVPLANELGLINKKGTLKDALMDVPMLLAEAKKRNVYMVARYVVMRDPGLASARPEWAIKNLAGASWKDDNGLSWPNPFQPEVADYNAALAKELAAMGFDEIQYDYIRFPTDGVLKNIQYKPNLSGSQLLQPENEKLRTSTINAAVKKGYDVLRTTDTFLSLDVFGMSLWREDDNNIGQQYDDLVMLTDYICPMVYPTHFDPGVLDLKQYPGHPGLYPEVIYEKSAKIASTLDAKLKPIAKYRPWLEDISKTWGSPIIKNTPERLRKQIETTERTSNYGWTIWHPAGEYQVPVLAAWAAKVRGA